MRSFSNRFCLRLLTGISWVVLMLAFTAPVASGEQGQGAAVPTLQPQWSAPAYWSSPGRPNAESQSRISPEMVTVVAPPQFYSFVPITPCRQYNSLNDSPLLQGANRSVTLTGAPCEIPTDAAAVSGNITVFNITGATGNGVFKIGTSTPPTSAWINYSPTETQRANAGILALNASGQIVVQVAQGGGQVDFIVDVNGYYIATTLTASVNSNGTLARSSHVTGATRLATGQYEVVFDRDVSSCTYIATIGLAQALGPPAAFVSTALSAASNLDVFVLTANTAGAITDEPFHLLVTCSGPFVGGP